MASLGFARAPTVKGGLRLIGGVGPEPAPAAEQCGDQQQKRDVAPVTLARGAGSCHYACNTCRMRRFWAVASAVGFRTDCLATSGLLRERRRRALSTTWSISYHNEQKNRSKRRRPVGLRLRIADVAARIYLPGTAPCPPGGRPPGALRLF